MKILGFSATSTATAVVVGVVTVAIKITHLDADIVINPWNNLAAGLSAINTVTAQTKSIKQGEQITFQFAGTGHNVFLNSIDSCSGGSQIGSSGPVIFDSNTVPSDELPKKLFFYCGVNTHCSSQGQKINFHLLPSTAKDLTPSGAIITPPLTANNWVNGVTYPNQTLTHGDRIHFFFAAAHDVKLANGDVDCATALGNSITLSNTASTSFAFETADIPANELPKVVTIFCSKGPTPGAHCLAKQRFVVTILPRAGTSSRLLDPKGVDIAEDNNTVNWLFQRAPDVPEVYPAELNIVAGDRIKFVYLSPAHTVHLAPNITAFQNCGSFKNDLVAVGSTQPPSSPNQVTTTFIYDSTNDAGNTKFFVCASQLHCVSQKVRVNVIAPITNAPTTGAPTTKAPTLSPTLAPTFQVIGPDGKVPVPNVFNWVRPDGVFTDYPETLFVTTGQVIRFQFQGAAHDVITTNQEGYLPECLLASTATLGAQVVNGTSIVDINTALPAFAGKESFVTCSKGATLHEHCINGQAVKICADCTTFWNPDGTLFSSPGFNWRNNYPNELNTLFVNDGDVLRFTFNNLAHDVQEVLSQEDFDSCNKNAATNINSLNLPDFGVRFNASERNTRYFICTKGNHCATNKQRVKVIVNRSLGPDNLVASNNVNNWVNNREAIYSLTMNPRDTITFQFTTSHDVQQIPTLAKFENCDFTGATQLSDQNAISFNYTISEEDEGKTLWFACSKAAGGHCRTNQKLAVRVNGVLRAQAPPPGAPEPGNVDEAVPNAVDPGVAVAGAIIAVFFVGTALVIIQRRRASNARASRLSYLVATPKAVDGHAGFHDFAPADEEPRPGHRKTDSAIMHQDDDFDTPSQQQQQQQQQQQLQQTSQRSKPTMRSPGLPTQVPIAEEAGEETASTFSNPVTALHKSVFTAGRLDV